MARTLGLFRRGGIYYLRVMLPPEIRGEIRSQRKLVRSLHTAEAPVAKLRAAQLRALMLFGECSDGSPLTASGPSARPALGHTLRAVFDRWEVSRKSSGDTHAACHRGLLLFEEVFGASLDLSELKRSDGDRFRAWLLDPQRGTSSKTARDRFTWVKSLLKYAARDLEWLPKSPWEGLDIQVTATSVRRPWGLDELRILFSQPLFTQGELPVDQRAGREAAYWIPLLGLFHGVRLGELAQLVVADILQHGGVWCLRVAAGDQEQRLKTAASERFIPIHSALLRLGFIQLVEQRRRDGEAVLWPSLPRRKGKAGGFFSQWFGIYRRSLGFGEYPDFHCFRHTVRTQLAEAAVSEPTIDLLLGHQIKGSTGAKVYTHRSISLLKAAVETIQFQGLKLNQLPMIR